MRKILFLVLISSLLFSVNIIAQNTVGTSAAPFLGIAIGPRAQAMGGALTADATDVTAAYWNPGALSRIGKSQAMVSHTNWLLGTYFNWIGISINLGSSALGFSLTHLDYGREEITTMYEQDGTDRYWDASDVAFAVSFAQNMTEQFSLGGSAKIIHTQIWNETATAFAVDFGVLYYTSLKGLRLGMSISNFGSKMRLDGQDLIQKIDIDDQAIGHADRIEARLRTDDWSLPIFYRIGIAWDLVQLESNTITFSADAIHPSDNVEYINFGMEYVWNGMVALRGGYKSMFQEDSEEGLTVGAGVKYNASGIGDFQIDYSFADFGILQDVQTIAFTVSF